MKKLSILFLIGASIFCADSFALDKAAVDSNSIYEKFMHLSDKDQAARLDVAYHTSGNKVVDLDNTFSDQQKKFVKRSFEIMSNTVTNHKKEISDCVKARLPGGSSQEGSFDSGSSLFTFKDIKSRRTDQKKGHLTSEELLNGLNNPSGYRLKIIQIVDGGTAQRDLRETPSEFIIGLGVPDKYLVPQNTPEKKKAWDYAMSGKNGNIDMTRTRDIKVITDESFLAGVMAHEMAHNYGLDHSDIGSSDFTYVGELGYCVTLVARRNSIPQKVNPSSGSKSSPGQSGSVNTNN